MYDDSNIELNQDPELRFIVLLGGIATFVLCVFAGVLKLTIERLAETFDFEVGAGWPLVTLESITAVFLLACLLYFLIFFLKNVDVAKPLAMIVSAVSCVTLVYFLLVLIGPFIRCRLTLT